MFLIPHIQQWTKNLISLGIYSKPGMYNFVSLAPNLKSKTYALFYELCPVAYILNQSIIVVLTGSCMHACFDLTTKLKPKYLLYKFC